MHSYTVSVTDCCFEYGCVALADFYCLSCQTGQLFGAPDQDQSSARSSLSCPHISAQPSVQVCVQIHVVTAVKYHLIENKLWLQNALYPRIECT